MAVSWSSKEINMYVNILNNVRKAFKVTMLVLSQCKAAYLCFAMAVCRHEYRHTHGMALTLYTSSEPLNQKIKRNKISNPEGVYITRDRAQPN